MNATTIYPTIAYTTYTKTRVLSSRDVELSFPICNLVYAPTFITVLLRTVMASLMAKIDIRDGVKQCPISLALHFIAPYIYIILAHELRRLYRIIDRLPSGKKAKVETHFSLNDHQHRARLFHVSRRINLVGRHFTL